MNRVAWTRAAIYGLIWGVAVTAMESFELPLGDLTTRELLVFHANLLPHLCLAGIALSAYALASAPQRVNAAFVAALLVGFPLLTCAINWTMKNYFSFGDLWATDGGSSYIHTYWTTAAYGSVFVIALRLRARTERVRTLLARSEIARQQAESAMAASEFEALEGHVDPAFLLRVIETVQTRYQHDGVAADKLLDGLVGFLRAAMPAIRSGVSTLASEIELARQYSLVLRELDPLGSLDLEIFGNAPDTPFPPLLMLPILDQLCVVDHRVGLEVLETGEGVCKLSFNTPKAGGGSWLAPDLAYRLHVGLRSLFAGEWTLTLDGSPGQPMLLLTVPVNRIAGLGSLVKQEAAYG